MITDEEKRAIISRFRAQGILLSPEELERLASPSIPPATITPTNIAAFMHRRFDALRPLLEAKNPSVSIVHAAGDTMVIGMVRERTTRGFIIDDTTGTLSVISENNQTQAGDIIAVSGRIREDQLAAHTITYPDIPFSNPPMQIACPLMLVHPVISAANPSPPKTIQNTPHTVPSNHITAQQNHPLSISPPPTLPVRLASPAILIHQPPTPLSPADAQQCLVRRFFPPAIPAGPDPLLLDALPSLVWLLQDTNWQKSHKGVLIISTTPGHQAAIAPDLTVTFQQIPLPP